MKSKIIFFLIIFLGLLVRLVGLGSRPVGFTWDEAAIGYNAYSLLKTGRDEYGQVAPVVFRSFGDYKPGLYIYFTVPSVFTFGLTEFSTRLPSAVFGTLLLPVLYILTRLLFIKSTKNAALCAMGVAALNPWLLNFSRGAWEANLSLLLSVLGLTLFIKKSYLLAFILFGLTMWSYQSAKLLTPLIIFSLLLVYKDRLNLKKIVLPFLLLLLLLLPVMIHLADQSGRLKVFSVFSYTRKDSDIRQILLQDQTPQKNLVFYLFHSEMLDQLRGVLQRYSNHFSPRFLLTEGDWTNLRHTVFRHGYFYLTDLALLIIGLIYLIKHPSQSNYLLFSLLLLAPVPSALSRDLVSGVRSLFLSLPLCIIAGIGLSIILNRRSLSALFLILQSLLVIYYFDFLIFHQPFYSGQDWVSPYKQAFTVVNREYANYSTIYFTDQLGQPYIFALFFSRFDPAAYQRQARLVANTSGDVGSVTGFDKYRFGPVFWPKLRGTTDALFIGGQYELPQQDLTEPGLSKLADIYYPNGEYALKIVGINND